MGRRGRRNHRRVPAGGCRVDVSCRGRFLFSKELSYNNRMVDLSEGGVQLYHENALPKGTPVSLAIRTPKSYRENRFRGQVAWTVRNKTNRRSCRYAIGVQFKPMRRAELGRLRRLMDLIAVAFRDFRATEDHFSDRLEMAEVRPRG